MTCERQLTRTECAELSECELTELLQRCFDRSTIRLSVSGEGRCTVCPRERVGLEREQDDCLRKSPATWTFFFSSSEIIVLLSNVKECLCGLE